MTSFIAEDGTGLDTATSLVTVAFADDYFSLRGYTAWAALSTSAKQMHLILATDYTEFRYSDKYISSILYPDTPQALAWPRNLDVSFPDRIKKAVCEYAKLSVGDTLLSEPVLNGGQMIKRKRERFIQVEEEVHYEIDRNGKFIPHPVADALIAPYLRAGGLVIR